MGKAGRTPAQDPPAGVDYSRVLTGPGYRPTTALGGLVVALLCFELVAPLVMYAVLGVGYLARGRPDGSFGDYGTTALAFTYPEGMVAAQLRLACLIPVSMLLVRFLHGRRPVWLASVQPGMRWRFMILAAIAAIIIANGVYWLTDGRTTFHYDPQHGWQGWLVLIVVLTPLQAAGEEYLFRGYLTQVIGSFVSNRWVAVAISSLFFAIAHGTGQSPSLFVNRFAFGAVMGVLAVVTGGLEASVAAHAVNNVFAFGYGAASAGGVAGAMAVTDVTWTATAWNIAAYALIGLAAWTIGIRLNVARTTPGRVCRPLG